MRTVIDVQAALREKLGEEMQEYPILGAATRRSRTAPWPRTDLGSIAPDRCRDIYRRDQG